jgi:hypothetical protein
VVSDFLDNRKGDQKVAYDAAKLYLDNCPADPNDAQAKYMREKFVEPYEALQQQAGVGKQFEAAIASKNYGEQIKIGKADPGERSRERPGKHCHGRRGIV